MMFLVDNFEMKYYAFDEEDFEFCELDENDNEIYIDSLDELESQIYEINDYAYDKYELFYNIRDVDEYYKYGGDLKKSLVIPNDLDDFLIKYVDMIGDDSSHFEITNALIEAYNAHKFNDETNNFIFFNMMEISEVISGKRECRVKEKEFYALMIGHENVQGTPHWAYSRRKNRLSINYITGYQGDVIKMTKDEWSKLNINESNAIFTLTLK